jgi:biotin operon repressor
MDEQEMVAVMRDPQLSVGARLLYWELSQWVSEDLRACFPPQHTLVSTLGVSRASIIRWTQELQDSGLVAVKRIGRGNRYSLFSRVS